MTANNNSNNSNNNNQIGRFDKSKKWNKSFRFDAPGSNFHWHSTFIPSIFFSHRRGLFFVLIFSPRKKFQAMSVD